MESRQDAAERAGVEPPPSGAGAPVERSEFYLRTGKLTGVLAVFLGWVGLGAVVALRFPQQLSTPDLRVHYPMHVFRLLIDVVLIAALVLGLVSLVIARRKSRGVLGASLAALAMVLGGSRVPVDDELRRRPTSASTGSCSRCSSTLRSSSCRSSGSSRAPPARSSAAAGAPTSRTSSSATCWCR